MTENIVNMKVFDALVIRQARNQRYTRYASKACKQNHAVIFLTGASLIGMYATIGCLPKFSLGDTRSFDDPFLMKDQ